MVGNSGNYSCRYVRGDGAVAESRTEVTIRRECWVCVCIVCRCVCVYMCIHTHLRITLRLRILQDGHPARIYVIHMSMCPVYTVCALYREDQLLKRKDVFCKSQIVCYMPVTPLF